MLLTVVLAVVSYHVLIDSTSSWDYSGIRLQRSFALRAGAPLYPPRDAGAVLITLYGPVGAVAYLPATIARRPAGAVLAGQLLSWLFVFGTLGWLHCRSARRAGRQWRWAALGFLTGAALIVDVRPLEYVAFTVHVDAPALALAAMACGLLVFRDRDAGWCRLLAAASCAVLALWTKQMVLPLLVVLPVYLALTAGRRAAGRFLLCLLLAAGLISAAVWWLFDPVDLLFHLWTMPSRHLDGIGPGLLLSGVERLLRETAVIWVVAGAALVLLLRRRHAGVDPWQWRREPAVLFILVGLAELPLALLGYLKIAGDVNAMSYVAYFIICGATLLLAGEASATSERAARAARRTLWALPAGLLLMVMLVQEPGSLDTWRRPLALAELPHERAFEYARRHPHEIYFPRLTLVSYLAEGEIYHQSAGLLDRQAAGLPLSQEHLRAHLPARMRAIAMAENGFMSEIEELGLPEFSQAFHDPQLPGFVIYRRPDDESP